MRTRLLLRAVVAVSAILAIVFSVVLPASATPTRAAVTTPMTNVRLLHADPGAGPIDIFLDGTRVFGNASYKDFSTYEMIAPGTHKVTIYPGGTDLYSGGPVPRPLATTQVTVPAAKTWWTMVAVARGRGFGFAWVKDDLSVPESGMARVRFVHVSPGTPAVAVELQGTGYLSQNLAYTKSSPTTLVATGAMTVVVHPAGWGSVVATRLANYTFLSGHVYSFYLIGQLQSGPRLQILDDVIATQASVRIIHAMPGTGSVDVFIAGTRAFGAATYGDASPYTPVAANAQDLTVYRHNPDIALPLGTKMLDMPVNFTPDMTYTLVLLPMSGKFSTLALPDDTSAPSTGMAKLRVVHLSPDAGAVDVGLNGLGLPFTAVAFGTAANYDQVKPGTYTAAVHPAGMTSVVLNLPGLTLAKGGVYTLFILGKAKGTPALQATLVQDV